MVAEKEIPSELFKLGPCISGYISWTCQNAMYFVLKFVNENPSPQFSQRESSLFLSPITGQV